MTTIRRVLDDAALADSPPQTDLTMLSYHEVNDGYPCPPSFDGEDEDGYD